MSDEVNTPKETHGLQPQHIKYLTDRGIPLELAIKAGVGSIDGASALQANALKKRFPGLVVYPSTGLLIPYLVPTQDGIPRARIRWDDSRYYKGTPGTSQEESVPIPRYTAQAGVSVAPYYPPGVLVEGVVDDPSIDLFVVEAPAKALSLVAHGFKAVGLGGVEAGFHDVKERTASDHLAIHPELDRVLWRGRRVYINYDAGITNNPRVAMAATKLAVVLRDRGADVRLVILPHVHTQERDFEDHLRFDLDDQGPDDFLAKHGAVEFRKLIEQAVEADPITRVKNAMASEGKDQKREVVAALLADLTFISAVHVGGRVVADQIAALIKSTGIKLRAIHEQVGKLLKRVERQAKESDAETDLPYVIQDGRIAMTTLIGGVPTVRYLTEFTANITEEITTDDGVELQRVLNVEGKLPDGKVLPMIDVPASDFSKLEWASQWGSKAIIRAGKDTRDHTRVAIQALSKPTHSTVFTHMGWRNLDGRQVYLHPGGAIGSDSNIRVNITGGQGRYGFPDAAIGIKEAVKLSLSILNSGPLEITLPVLASAYTAVLSELLAVDFGVWMVGMTGTFKSSIAALAQGHFGAFSHSSLPASWYSTVNYLEAQLFRMKDTLLVIDNYVPGQTTSDQQQLTVKALRLIQCIGDRASRGRLDRNSQERAARSPRGLTLMTGEDLPPTNESTLGRLIVIDVGKGSLQLDRLAAIQDKAEQLPHAMRAFIEWLAPKLTTEADKIRQLRRETASSYRVQLSGVHERTPNSLAAFAVGFGLFLDFALEQQAITEDEHERLIGNCDETLLRLARKQRINIEGAKPTERYLSGLRALLLQGRVALATKDQQLDYVTLPHSRGIGWLDDDHVYLMPDLAWEAAEQFHSREGWPYRKTQLHKQLADAGIVIRDDIGDDTESRLTCRRTLGGSIKRVLVIDRQHFEEAISDPDASKTSADDREQQKRDDLSKVGVIVNDHDADYGMN